MSDAGKLAKIRDILNNFNWEHDDRELALEEIDRIIFGGDDE
jgi:hypothetical protein